MRIVAPSALHCAALAKLGDDYLAFLAAQFGPRTCKAGPAAPAGH
jgi:hypothetical protein